MVILKDILKDLAPHPAENKAFCILCNSTIKSSRSSLIRHSQVVHIENVRFQKQSLDINFILHTNKVKRVHIENLGFKSKVSILILFCIPIKLNEPK